MLVVLGLPILLLLLLLLPLPTDQLPYTESGHQHRVSGVAGYNLEKGYTYTDHVLDVVFSLVRDRAVEIGQLFGFKEKSDAVKRLADTWRQDVLISMSPNDVVATGTSLTTVLVVELVRQALDLEVIPHVASTGEVGMW